ncbi:MAG TPA: tRNA (adenosine(37)-N6)-dimethylallyltransferase MiaA [Candidatus Acidoferrales bacterium]|nr:tRNA (adenosine(37)-N6)-dimethylallyltransferase MiaA [Candidatus Acidoferrales bacterium]
MPNPCPVLAIVGPTGSGKTEAAIEIAERFDAEIVNADSRQVYRQLDIGSAKPTAAQQQRVRHHLIDVVDPDERFDAARFRLLALAAIADVVARGKRVLVVGGTGLYVKVLRGGLFDGPSRDSALRARLQAEEEAEPGCLHRRLTEIDPATASRLHVRDRVRLIRALEVYLLSGRPISEWQRQHSFGNDDLHMHIVALSLPRSELYRRIDARCQAMIAAGLVDEVRRLFAAGFDPQLPSLQSPGYREVGEHLRGLCDLGAALSRMAKATRNLAKRQLTWFRGDRAAVWVEPSVEALLAEVRRCWANGGDA